MSCDTQIFPIKLKKLKNFSRKNVDSFLIFDPKHSAHNVCFEQKYLKIKNFPMNFSMPRIITISHQSFVKLLVLRRAT